MCPASPPTPIACASATLSAVDTDLLIVPWFKDEAADALPLLDAATGGELKRALSAKEFQAKPYEVWLTPIAGNGWKARGVLFIGGGGAERASDLVRRLAAPARPGGPERLAGRGRVGG